MGVTDGLNSETKLPGQNYALLFITATFIYTPRRGLSWHKHFEKTDWHGFLRSNLHITI